MIKIDSKTLQDLEFHTVLEQTSQLCITESGKEKLLQWKPYSTLEKTIRSLREVYEYFNSLQGDNPIPNHGFDAVFQEIHLLGVENSTLEVNSFRKILSICETTKALLSFFEKNKQFYVQLHLKSGSIELDNYIVGAIKAVIDRFGEIKDDATPELAVIRRAINGMKGKINGSFNTALAQAASGDYLDEIKESV